MLYFLNFFSFKVASKTLVGQAVYCSAALAKTECSYEDVTLKTKS